MKILIVGATSMLGRALKPVLAELGEVVTAGRKNCDITLDLADSVEKIFIPRNMDAVVHTAANFGGKSISDILAAENINVLGTLKLCHAAVEAGVKHFILISSIFSCLKEGAGQYNIYALSKKHAEEAARFYCALHSLPLTILRPSQIYGSNNDFRTHQPFFYTIINKAEQGEDVTLYGSNDARRNYIHIDDLAKIIASVIKGRVEGTYACLYPQDISYSQIAQAAFHAFNSKASVHFLKDKADIPDNVFEQDDTLYLKIGFYPQISIEDGMRQIAHHRSAQA